MEDVKPSEPFGQISILWYISIPEASSLPWSVTYVSTLKPETMFGPNGLIMKLQFCSRHFQEPKSVTPKEYEVCKKSVMTNM